MFKAWHDEGSCSQVNTTITFSPHRRRQPSLKGEGYGEAYIVLIIPRFPFDFLLITIGQGTG